MDWWRISKYDPALRDESNVYRRDEWTSAADIGRTHDGKTLDAETYRAVETAHVEAVRAFIDDAGVAALTVTSFQGPSERDYEYLETLSVPDSPELARQMQQIHEGAELSGPVGTVAPSERAIARTRALGLFVEETRDPST